MRTPSCDKNGLKKGTWTAEDDLKLFDYVTRNGHDNWRKLPKRAGLARCGKSCRLRWMNYLRPGVKRGNFTHEEQETIIRLHAMHGNKWSMIASHLPGRSDNEIKNHWHAYLKRRIQHDSVTLANEQSEASTPNNHHPTNESIQEPEYEEIASSPTQNSSLATTPDASPSSQYTSMNDFLWMLPEPAPATDANFVSDDFTYVMDAHTDPISAFSLNDLDEISYLPGEFFAPFVSETESFYPVDDVWGLLE